MAKTTTTVLLTENVEDLGIVGDVVNVRPGYARNFLLPMGLAAEPTEEAVAALAQKRAEAEREMRELRSQREALFARLENVEVTLVRACNDRGMLYGSVTARDIAEALFEEGYGVRSRDVRLAQPIKRIDTYTVSVRLDADLETEIKVWVAPDRELDFDDEKTRDDANAEAESAASDDQRQDAPEEVQA